MEIDYLLFNNKNIYYGEIKNDKANGYGMFKNTIGQIKYGYFEDNKFIKEVSCNTFSERMLYKILYVK